MKQKTTKQRVIGKGQKKNFFIYIIIIVLILQYSSSFIQLVHNFFLLVLLWRQQETKVMAPQSISSGNCSIFLALKLLLVNSQGMSPQAIYSKRLLTHQFQNDLREALEIGSYQNFCSFTGSQVSKIEQGNFFSIIFTWKQSNDFNDNLLFISANRHLKK